MFNPGDVIVIDFPGVAGVKRRPTVVVSSPAYHAARPDVVVGLITSQTTAIGPTDYVLQDWAQAGLRVPSVFRSFFSTLPSTTHPVQQVDKILPILILIKYLSTFNAPADDVMQDAGGV